MIEARPLCPDAFAPFGDVIAPRPQPSKMINAGLCGRHHALSLLDIEAPAGISLFDAEARQLPYTLDLMERHPLGAQSFIPMNGVPMLVTVAPDEGGKPGKIQAFVTQGEGITIARNVWHGVLAPIEQNGLYAVVDYVGKRENLEECCLTAEKIVILAGG